MLKKKKKYIYSWKDFLDIALAFNRVCQDDFPYKLKYPNILF